MNLLQYNKFYLVGIKGVAMTSLAQMLVDAGKQVAGSDVAEEFVTQEILNTLPIQIDQSLTALLPAETECVIYTSAHLADQSSQVQQARARNLAVFSQAEAVAFFFNQQHGLAVCGVGGKSTTSAMLTWIFEELGRSPSFSVGVGNIPGLNRTGRWNPEADEFIIEADEYVINPHAAEQGEELIPRFTFLKPELIVCTNLKYDHPDVYRDFAHTKQVFADFFAQLPADGTLIVQDKDLAVIAQLPQIQTAQFKILTYGESSTSDLQLLSFKAEAGKTETTFSWQSQEYQLELLVPGLFNALNALSAILAAAQLGLDPTAAAQALASFRSTKRRFEYIGTKDEVDYYDDYAHHPHEIEAMVAALNEWFPGRRKVIAFQSHTYSRTKELFDQFVSAFAEAKEVVMIDIFSSAREKNDPTITSDKLCAAINQAYQIPAQNLGSLAALAEFCQQELHSGDVLLTMGAGDIYLVHEMI